jgi:hypothetical protein
MAARANFRASGTALLSVGKFEASLDVGDVALDVVKPPVHRGCVFLKRRRANLEIADAFLYVGKIAANRAKVLKH